MKFFFKNDQMGPLFQIFLIFQLLSGGVINLSYCTKLVVTCRRVVNYVIAIDLHTKWGNGFFFRKNCDFSTFWNFHFFHFSDLSLFLSEFSTVGDGIGLKMFTYDPYYPTLAITPFRPNGPFTYEMAHIETKLCHSVVPKSAAELQQMKR